MNRNEVGSRAAGLDCQHCHSPAPRPRAAAVQRAGSCVQTVSFLHDNNDQTHLHNLALKHATKLQAGQGEHRQKLPAEAPTCIPCLSFSHIWGTRRRLGADKVMMSGNAAFPHCSHPRPPSDMGTAESCSCLCWIFPGLSKTGGFGIPALEGELCLSPWQDVLRTGWLTLSWWQSHTNLSLTQTYLGFFFPHWATILSTVSTLAYTILFCSSWDSNSGSWPQINWG